MENYNNSSGTDALVGGAGSIISSVIDGYFAKGEAKKALKLQAEISQLTLAQQKTLEERLQDVQSETERQGMIYQYLIVQNNNEMINRIQGKRYTSYIVLGVGVALLAFVVLKLAKK
jgi:hypothetical protein